MTPTKKKGHPYEYKDAVHVPFPALGKRPIDFVGVSEAHGPDLRRGVHDRRGHSVVCHWEGWELCDLVTTRTKKGGAAHESDTFSIWTDVISNRRHVRARARMES